MRLTEIARRIDAEIVSSVGGDPEIGSAMPPGESTPSDLTMIDSADRVGRLTAAAVITPVAIDPIDTPQLVVANPHAAFARIISLLRPPLDDQPLPHGVSPVAQIHCTATVHPTAVIADDVVIGAGTRVMPGAVVMSGCRIGDDVVIGPSVTLYPYTRVGDRCVLHAGCVLGARGFGYRREGNRHVPTAQLGYVVLDTDVELGAAVTVDRGTYGTTRIGEGTKIDNQVMIAHNCQIGRRNLICSQVGVAGSCSTGDDVILAGQVGLKDHVHLADSVVVGAQAGVMEDLDGDQVYLGSPCTTQKDQMQIMAVQRRLPEMRRDLKTLKRNMAAVQQQIVALEQSASADIANAGQPSRRAA